MSVKVHVEDFSELYWQFIFVHFRHLESRFSTEVKQIQVRVHDCDWKQIKYIWGKVNGHLLMSSSIKTFGFEKKINGPYLVVSYSRYRFENLPQSDCLSRKSENELEKIEWELSSGGKTNYWFRFYFSNLLENEWTGVLVKTSL